MLGPRLGRWADAREHARAAARLGHARARGSLGAYEARGWQAADDAARARSLLSLIHI